MHSLSVAEIITTMNKKFVTHYMVHTRCKSACVWRSYHASSVRNESLCSSCLWLRPGNGDFGQNLKNVKMTAPVGKEWMKLLNKAV